MAVTPLAENKASIVTDQYVDGQSIQGKINDAVIIRNPFDNTEICRIHPADEGQVNEAIETAHIAFQKPSWQKLTGRERGTLLYKLAELLRRDLEEFAIIESMDTGIPIRETRMEVSTSALHIEYYAGFAGKIEGTYQDLGTRFNFTRREPYGVIGQIVPWNTPLKLMARGFSAAVACGNTIVIKPSIVAPLSNLRFAKLVKESRFPTRSNKYNNRLRSHRRETDCRAWQN